MPERDGLEGAIGQHRHPIALFLCLVGSALVLSVKYGAPVWAAVLGIVVLIVMGLFVSRLLP